MRIPKFKVGDKVKILQEATMVGVEQEDVGKIGMISSVNENILSKYSGLRVQMNEICIVRGYKPNWSVGYSMVELSLKKGEQLLFSFMKE